LNPPSGDPGADDADRQDDELEQQLDDADDTAGLLAWLRRGMIIPG
jgi:hypothetical protein